MALRELALRRTADRVEDDVQAYRTDKSIERVWKTEDSLLCCIGPGPGGENVVRSAARLAGQLGVEWTAVIRRDAGAAAAADRERERILRAVKLAQDFGAKTAILAGSDPAAADRRIRARAQLLEGRRRPRLARSRGGRGVADVAQRIGALAPDIDLIEVGRAPRRPRGTRRASDERRSRATARSACATCGPFLACVATTLVALVLLRRTSTSPTS